MIPNQNVIIPTSPNEISAPFLALSNMPLIIFMKISARNYFQQLEQRIQAEASNIDNYLEQRVQILQNVVGILDRAIDLDKDVMKAVAALRGGRLSDDTRSEVNAQVNTAFRSLFPQVEA